MEQTHRCIVTGRDASGKSVVERDSRIATGTLGITDFWKTTASPASLTADWTPSEPIRLEPAPGGTIFRFFLIPRANHALPAEQADRVAGEAFASIGAGHCRVDTRRHALMHTTATIDYIVILKGRVTLLLDEGEVALSPFDVVVQRGTNHWWLNHDPEPALLMGVVVDAR
jgi:hypothetical protein